MNKLILSLFLFQISLAQASSLCDPEATIAAVRQAAAREAVDAWKRNFKRSELGLPVATANKIEIKAYPTELLENILPLLSHTISGKDPADQDYYQPIVLEYAKLLNRVAPQPDVETTYADIAARVKANGLNASVVLPALDLINLSYALEEDNLAVPLISIIGRLNPAIGTLLLKHLDSTRWDKQQSYPSRAAYSAYSRSVFGVDLRPEAARLNLPPSDLWSPAKRLQTDGFFRAIRAENRVNDNSGLNSARVNMKLQNQLGVGFNSFFQNFTPDFARTPFSSYSDQQGIRIDRSYLYALGMPQITASGLAGAGTRVVTNSYASKLTEALGRSTIQGTYSRELKAVVYGTVGAVSGGGVGLMIALVPAAISTATGAATAALPGAVAGAAVGAGTIIAETLAGAVSGASTGVYDAYQEEDTILDAQDRIKALNAQYKSDSEALHQRHAGAQRDFKTKILGTKALPGGGDPASGSDLGSSLEAKQAKNRLDLKQKQEEETLDFDFKTDRFAEQQIIEDEAKNSLKGLSTVKKEEIVAARANERKEREEKLREKQSQERQAQTEAQGKECEEQGGCDSDYEEVKNEPDETKSIFDPQECEQYGTSCIHNAQPYALRLLFRMTLASRINPRPEAEPLPCAETVPVKMPRTLGCDPRYCDPDQFKDSSSGPVGASSPTTVKLGASDPQKTPSGAGIGASGGRFCQMNRETGKRDCQNSKDYLEQLLKMPSPCARGRHCSVGHSGKVEHGKANPELSNPGFPL